jgi:hypothetical protein
MVNGVKQIQDKAVTLLGVQALPNRDTNLLHRPCEGRGFYGESQNAAPVYSQYPQGVTFKEGTPNT